MTHKLAVLVFICLAIGIASLIAVVWAVRDHERIIEQQRIVHCHNDNAMRHVLVGIATEARAVRLAGGTLTPAYQKFYIDTIHALRPQPC